MCRNALAGTPANSHLDELESFYWVLFFIVCVHDGPGLCLSRQALSPDMELILADNCKAAARAKKDHFSRPFDLPLASFWGEPVVRLMRNLHLFIHKRILAEGTAIELGQDPPSHDPGADYNEISRHFSLAIQEIVMPRPRNDPLMETIETKRYRADFLGLYVALENPALKM